LSLEIIKSFDEYSGDSKEVVVTIGTFDGLHSGHQEILRRLMDSAKTLNMEAVAITFEPHPRVLVTPDDPPPLLSTWEEKVKLFSKYMDGKLVVLNFNKQIMDLTAEDFIKSYLTKKLKSKKTGVGYDHAFGKNRSGTINDLMGLSKIYSFELEVVNPILIGGRPISSSRIRRLIAGHELSMALEMFNHPYPISGEVIKGIGLGRKLGYPTANIDFHERKLLPIDGVYSCEVEHDGNRYNGMMFIGNNHFDPNREKSVEVNIYDFDKEIYGDNLICYPETFVRENIKFESTDKLVEQIKKDKEHILKLMK